ncbi:MAG: CAMK kinase [Lasallia pustulata]|uniref:CAMK kinase n=1 Tax=Lasallia pustulata TaxID=136370 RepID=A0A5M8PT59_9LECA|nr:MAG: CAMK kinase [Lasallia pustulata]
MTCSRNPPRIVLTDFGHAIKVTGSSSRMQRMLTTVGTLDYVAPEVHGINKTVPEQGYTKAVDMWSLGIVTSAVLTGRSIFVKTQASCQRRSSETAIIEAAAICNLQELDNSADWARISDQGKDFLKKLLVLDERERMTAVLALQHGWCMSKGCENNSGALYQHAIKTWKPRYRAPIDLLADLDLYANAQKPYIKCSPPPKRKRAAKPIEPHYQPPHQHLYQLVYPRRQHTALPSIAETNTEPPNIEKLRISEYSQKPTDETSVDTIIPVSRSVLMENAARADSQKPLDEEPPEEVGFANQGRRKLVRPTLFSNRRRSKIRGGPSAMSASRKSSRRSIFDITEDGPDPVTINDTTHMSSSRRLSPFTPINQKRKLTPVLEEGEESLVGPPVSEKRARWSFVKLAQPGAPDRTENVSGYWSSSRKAVGDGVTVRQDTSAQIRIQQLLEQDSTLIIPPPGFPEFYPVYTPQVSGDEDSSDLQEIPSSAESSERPVTRKDRRRSSFVDSMEVELHERAGRKIRGLRTGKAYGQDVEEMWGTLEAERWKEERRAVSGDLTDSIRTAY